MAEPGVVRTTTGRKPRARETSVALKHVIASASYVDAGGEPPPDVVVAAGLLFRTRELLLRELDAALNDVGTSQARHQVLTIVCHAAGGLQLSEIAARAAVHPTTMTSTIDRLERDGFIERRSDPKDRRGTLAVATKKGKNSYEQGRKALLAIDFGLANVPKGTVEMVISSLDRWALELERHAETS